MSKEETKHKIIQVLDHFSEKSLEDLLSFLKNIETKSSQLFGQESMKKILSEDKELLQKLAQ